MMNPRQRRQFFMSASGVALVGLIVLLANGLSTWLSLRLDLTSSQAYSLSKSSRQLVQGIDDPVIIKAYFSRDLPGEYSAVERYTRDLLVEYRAASHGKVTTEFVLSYPAEDFEQKAMSANLAPVQFQQVGGDQMAIRRVFMGLVLFYRDRSETIPVVRSLETLEYDLTSRIARMINRPRRTIALTQGHGELDWRQNPRLGPETQGLFDFKEWSLPAGATESIRADAVLVVGPRSRFDEKSLWALDQAVMRGTPLAFLMDVRNFVPSQFAIYPVDSGLQELLRNYGVELGDRPVMDMQCETIGITRNLMGMALTQSIRYPYLPLVTDVDRHSALLRGIDTLGLPFPATVEPSSAPVMGVVYKPLFRSSPRSWLSPAGQMSAAPDRIAPPVSGERNGPFILGAVLQGVFPSYFRSRPRPFPGQTSVTASVKSKIVVLGTSQFMNPNMPDITGSSALLTNLMADLSNDETLVGIRSKGDLIRPLKPLTPRLRQALLLLSILAVPLLPVLWGLFRWRRRQKRLGVPA